MLHQISPHVYWMPPDVPDRPSLCAVVGADYTVMLDAGASAAHARLFLDALANVGVSAPSYAILTHWHWDHVFGAAEVGATVIAHNETARQLATLASYDWSDSALDARVASGEEVAFCADNIKLELPAPRTVTIKTADITFDDTYMLDLGGVTCRVQYVGGDHSPDSCVIYVAPDNVLFAGDCLYDAIYAPTRHYSAEKLLPLIDSLVAIDPTYIVEGHSSKVLDRAAFNTMLDTMQRAAKFVQENDGDESALLALASMELGAPLDEDTNSLITALIAGKYK
jgi:glyoxylase-like metal-dependent hydrolase (beta-lactamase superfamily II)